AKRTATDKRADARTCKSATRSYRSPGERSARSYSRTKRGRRMSKTLSTRVPSRMRWLWLVAAMVATILALFLPRGALADEPGAAPAPAAAASAPPTPEELAARVADLEAYVTNGVPKKLMSPGPGHNGWMMTSAALVLFMTLPGLALFYGGLVRRKNL